MTVKELMEWLQMADPNYEVAIYRGDETFEIDDDCEVDYQSEVVRIWIKEPEESQKE